MSKDQQTDINYYDRSDFQSRLAAKAAEKPAHVSRITAWLRGETIDQYKDRLEKEGQKVSVHRLYYEREQVERSTQRVLAQHGAKAFNQLNEKMPPPVRKLIVPGNQVRTLENMPHLGYVEILEMKVIYPDATMSRLKFVTSNFEAQVVPGEDGLRFLSIPPQRDGIRNKESYFIYGRKINPDGTPGGIDPMFAKDGMAYQPSDLRDVAKALFKIGEMSVKSFALLKKSGVDPLAMPRQHARTSVLGVDPPGLEPSLEELAGIEEDFGFGMK